MGKLIKAALLLVLVGGVGALGMLAGGWLGDAGRARRMDGRMLVAGASVLLAAPAAFWALRMPSGALPAFILFQGAAAFLMYMYYPTVYATIHDVVEPALRGRAMAIYFFAMYLLGASMGPVALGGLSDYFARQAGGVAASEQVRALGLHQAMYIVPALSLVLEGLVKSTPGVPLAPRGWLKDVRSPLHLQSPMRSIMLWV